MAKRKSSDGQLADLDAQQRNLRERRPTPPSNAFVKSNLEKTTKGCSRNTSYLPTATVGPMPQQQPQATDRTRKKVSFAEGTKGGTPEGDRPAYKRNKNAE